MAKTKNELEHVVQTSTIQPQMEPTSINKTIPKSITKFDAKKGSAGVGGIRAAVPQEHLQINKITCR